MRGRSHRCRSQSRPGEPPDAGLEAMTGGEPRGTGPSLQSGGSNSQGNARRIMAWALWGGGLLLLASASWLRNLGAAPLMDDTEPLFAEAARQMLLTGDWITPQFNGQPRFDKPPLLYWLMAASARLLGCHVWALRLPPAASAVLLTAALGATAARFGLSFLPDQAGGGAARSAASGQLPARWAVPAVTQWFGEVPRSRICC